MRTLADSLGEGQARRVACRRHLRHSPHSGSALRVDLQGLVPLSRSLADMLTEEGRAEGIEVRPMKLIYGMGVTDAAEFARRGIAATTLVAVPHGCVGRIVYHTRHDLVENLEPGVIDAVVRLVLRMIDRISREPATAFVGAPRAHEKVA